MLLLSVILLMFICHVTSEKTQKPHVILILADDLGFADLGFEGNDEIPTPNIDALAYNGVILNNHYTKGSGTPSRAALLTGKQPIHLGMQHSDIMGSQPWGLPLNETILPQVFRANGYTTYMVGKWGLGFYQKEYTPIFRGFDSHYGMWLGHQDYFSHIVTENASDEKGYDMRRNMETDWSAKGKYTTTLLTEEVVKVIKEHDASRPMFLFLSHLAPHTGNTERPLQAPDEAIAKFSHIDDPELRIYAAMISVLDQGIGRVVTALRQQGMLEDSIIVFLSDNGSPFHNFSNYRPNFPLRGVKNSPWEGAIKTPAIVWSSFLKKPRRHWNGLVDITDWFPTLLAAAGIEVQMDDLDGTDLWDCISEESPPLNFELWHNLDNVRGFGSLRRGDLKYVYWKNPSVFSEAVSSRYIEKLYHNSTYNIPAIISSETSTAITALLTYKQIEEKQKQGFFTTTPSLNPDMILSLRPSWRIQNVTSHPCLINSYSCLFNITEDPSEITDLSTLLPIEVARFKKDIEWILRSAVVSRSKSRDPSGDPSKHNGTWTNWEDSKEEKIVKSGFGHIPVVATIALIIIVGFLLLVRNIQQEPETVKSPEEVVEEGANGVNLQMLNEETKESES